MVQLPTLLTSSRALRTLTLTFLLATSGCASEGSAQDDEAWAVVAPVVAGDSTKDTTLYTSNREATMYQWAATNAPVLRVLPEHSVVRVANATERKGFFQVIHAGTWGWILGTEMTQRHQPLPDLSQRRVEALRLAQSAMGFSYWWSNARWQTSGPTILPISNKGECTGNCPKCTHKATGNVEYGADCSGFLSTVWGVGSSDADTDPDTNPDNNGFATKAFARANRNWSTIDWSDALTGDAVVRHDDTRKHIFMIGAELGQGWWATYECVGCEAGCRTQRRREADLAAWKVIRRTGWPDY